MNVLTILPSLTLDTIRTDIYANEFIIFFTWVIYFNTFYELPTYDTRNRKQLPEMRPPHKWIVSSVGHAQHGGVANAADTLRLFFVRNPHGRNVQDRHKIM